MKTVRGRITLILSALLTVILLAFSVSLHLHIKQRIESDFQRLVNRHLLQFEERFIREYTERAEPAQLRGQLDLYMKTAGIGAEIRHKGGGSLYVYASPDDGPHLSLTAPLESTTGEEFEISVNVSSSKRDRRLAQLGLFTFLFVPVAGFAVWLVTWFFTGRALAPFERIRSQAERISRENLADRVPTEHLQGEFLTIARTFNEMLDRLEKAFDDMKNFAGDAAHELRTPLASLRAGIETSIQKSRSVAQYRLILGGLSEEVSRMNRIVDDLFLLAKMDMRQLALEKKDVNLTDILRDTVDTWQALAASRNISIRMEGEQTNVKGDQVALQRVFMNLLENAVKYNREGGEVLVRVTRSNGQIEIEVRDDGNGIPAEDLPKLFERFYRVDKARARESGGAGLGLAICKSYVEAHEGSIDVTSRPNQGTVFTVRLPARRSGESQ